MQVSDCERVGGKGLFSLKFVPKGDIVFVLTGPVKDTPCKYSIEIGENQHILDDDGVFMNHSFDPSCKIDGKNVVAVKNILIGDELCFNYNESETHMACPFEVNGVKVKGKC